MDPLTIVKTASGKALHVQHPLHLSYIMPPTPVPIRKIESALVL